MTKTEYARIAVELNSLWPSSKWDVGTMRAGEKQLLDLDPGQVMAAVETLAAEGERFAPGPGQVRKRALEMVGEQVPSADEALSEVYRQIASSGYLRVPEWTHPAIGDTVAAMGGWTALCASEDAMADRAHFLRLYGTVTRRHETTALMPPCVLELLAPLNLSAQRALP